MRNRNCLLLLLLPFWLIAQTSVRGIVTDRGTGQPLAFANIQFNHDPKLQICSDINGKFVFKSQEIIRELSCSFVGYNKLELRIYEQSDSLLQIHLEPVPTNLQEVIVSAAENPANRIIRKVIDNKELNNPEKVATFRYQCYNKLVVDLKRMNARPTPSDSLMRYLKGKHVLLMESVSNRKFIRPDLSEEVVVASRVSGFKHPTFAALATDLQPFSFYENNIKLLNVYYLNPISRGSLKKYKFRLEETIPKDQDTVFVISFEPRSKKNFDGLKGVLYINSNRYAIQNVIASPHEKAKINLKIQQQYQWVANKYWFPEQLNYALSINNLGHSGMDVIVEGKSFLSKIEVDLELNKKDFSYQSVRLDRNATEKDSLFWDTSRNEPLSKSEQATYQFLDSVGRKNNFDRNLRILEKLVRGKLPYRAIDFDLMKTLQLNKYEGTRLGTGIYTNELFSRTLTLGGFGGYGFKDHAWKYGGEATVLLSAKQQFYAGFRHQSNLMEIGNYGLRSYSVQSLNLRSLIASAFDQIRQNSLQFKFKAFRFLDAQMSVNQTEVLPKYDQALGGTTAFKTTDFSFYGRYAFKEKIAQAFGRDQSLGSDYPILYFLFTKGVKGIFDSDLEYTKTELAVEHSFYMKNFGAMHFRIESGYINTSLPLGLMFTGEGSFDRSNPYVAKNTFQTMKPYEFVSDRYVNAFLSHQFGTLLLQTPICQPSFSLHQNISWGTVSNNTIDEAGSWKTKEKVFLEAGLQIDQIIKIDLMNIGFIGIGGAVFQRYGFYTNPDFHDNLAYKITANFTIR